MPKSAKKKAEKVADFSKAKLKLGKGKKVPSNVVDTSFKARSIALPSQSIAAEKDDTLPTTKRRQTFSDILSLLKHYSAGTRKDAIFSARELFEDHPGLLESSIAPLLTACVRLIGDEDAGVRKTLLSFFDWMLPRVGKEDLIPHVPLLLLFTTSAQTHIFPEIRVDAIRFLDLLLDVLPECVVDGWNASGIGHGKRALEGFLGMLSAGTKFGGPEGAAQATSIASVVLSPQSKLVVLRSLSSFLSHAIDSCSHFVQMTTLLPTWFLRPFFSDTCFYEEHKNVLPTSDSNVNGKCLVWAVEPVFESFDEDFAYDPKSLSSHPDTEWDLSNLTNLSTEQDNPSGSWADIPMTMRLARTLHATLTASFLDCAPVAFSPSTNPPETELQMLLATVRITRTLYCAIFESIDQGSDLLACCEELRTLLGYLSGYFPFTPAHREAKIEQTFQDLNVIYCELSSLLAFVSHEIRARSVQGRNPRLQASRRKSAYPSIKSDTWFNMQTDLVSCYVIRLLQGEGGSGAQLPRPISATVYIALLPTVWALLNRKDQSGGAPSSVLAATLDHALRTTSNAAVKRLTIEFVARLLLLEKATGYTGHFNPRDAGEEHKFREWVLHLPRTLWELGTNNLATTHTIFCVLLRLLQRESCVMQHEQISSLSSRLTPFFVMTHPIRGQILGPFSRIPSSASYIRRLALDLCASILADQTKNGGTGDEGLAKAVFTAVQGTMEEQYWARVSEAMRMA